MLSRIEEYVLQWGYNVFGKSNTVEDAKYRIELDPPDCIISSARFHDKISGSELTSNLTDHIIPIIYIDEENSEENYNLLNQSPVSRYIVYPFDSLNLRSILDDLNENVIALYSSNLLYGKYIFLKIHQIFNKVNLIDIDYLMSTGNYTTIYKGDEKYVLKYSLTRLLDIPNFRLFLRIHRNYAVQKKSILQIDFGKRELKIPNMTLPFGRTYTKAIRNIMNLPYNYNTND